ncbi:2902_t:CDS:1, partial [Paraglomus occultum]
NGEFAINFSSLCNTPSNRFNTCWRVISDNDVVCNVPVGFDNPELLQYISNNSIFDYAHVGETIRLFRNGHRPKTNIRKLLKKEEDVSSEQPEVTPAALEDDKPDRFMPPFVKDHLVHRYLMALQKARPHFSTPPKKSTPKKPATSTKTPPKPNN